MFKSTTTRLLATLLPLLSIGASGTPSTIGLRPAAICTLTDADRAANRALSYEEFDQQAVGRNARALADRGCYRAAADAAADYLISAPKLSAGAARNIAFHMAQDLALGGEEMAAAYVVTTARDPGQAPDAAFDWNTYVEGTYAFLIRDKGHLEAMARILHARTERPNQINARRLDVLVRLFDRSYHEAYLSPLPRDQD